MNSACAGRERSRGNSSNTLGEYLMLQTCPELLCQGALDDSSDRLFTLGTKSGGIVEDPDARLLDALRQRTPEAFGTLIQRHERRLLATAIKVTGNREDAEDALQNTFLQVYRHIEGFRGECRFTSWLTRILINQSLMVLRRRKNLNVSIDDCADDGSGVAYRDIKDPCYTPEESFLKKELSERLNGALGKLRLPNRGAAELHYLEHMSIEEIANAIGITISATKSRLLRARRELRRDGAGYLGLRSNEQTRPLER